MPTCTTCGASFTLPKSVQDKYPGWTPKVCLNCKGGKKSGGAPVRGGAGRGRPLIEENLRLAEVLEKYTDGPHDGVFTDGSSVPNPGPGGWGAVYVKDGHIVDQARGQDPSTTNNRMELTALIAGYDLVPLGERTTVYTDSNLAVQTVNEWAESWERRGWKRKTGPIQNLELVQALYAKAKARPEIKLVWIKAHNGSRWNEYADSLSTAWLRKDL